MQKVHRWWCGMWGHIITSSMWICGSASISDPDITPLSCFASKWLSVSGWVWGWCRWVGMVEVLDSIRGVGEVGGWKPFIVRVRPALEFCQVV